MTNYPVSYSNVSFQELNRKKKKKLTLIRFLSLQQRAFDTFQLNCDLSITSLGPKNHFTQQKWEREACSEQKLAREELDPSAEALIEVIYYERTDMKALDSTPAVTSKEPTFLVGLFLRLHDVLKKTDPIPSDFYNKPETN